MSKSLEERLKTHSNAFDGLLSLIPAKFYYDEATQNQWKEKKKSKEELKQNKKLKLDPTTVAVQNSSAKDILLEREKEAKPVKIPGSKLSKDRNESALEKKEEEKVEEEEEEENVPEFNDSEVDNDDDDDDDDDNSETREPPVNDDIDLIQVNGGIVFDDEGNEIEKLQEEKVRKEEIKQKQIKSGKKQLTVEEQKERDERLAKLREKLSSKITALKEKRKAPGTKVAGAPSSREQILEQRKLKLEQLKKRKLEKMEESENSENSDEDDDEEDDNEDATAKESSSVLFQNIVFDDGDKITSDLTTLRQKKTKKGPANNDIKAHLAKLQQQKQKLSEMDSDKRSKHEEKSKWNRLISNIEGVKLKDDEKLLKKALKRKEKQKMKSEREWRERKETVESTIAARTKRRDENLQLRRENKGKKAKHQQKMKRKFTGIVNKRTTGDSKKKRAGFEGGSKSGMKKK